MTQIRDATAARIVDALGVPRTAARAWLWFLDGAILDWLEHRDLSRDELRDFLLGVLAGSLTAAGWAAFPPPSARRHPRSPSSRSVPPPSPGR